MNRHRTTRRELSDADLQKLHRRLGPVTAPVDLDRQIMALARRSLAGEPLNERVRSEYDSARFADLRRGISVVLVLLIVAGLGFLLSRLLG
ncbi:hypothetical protein Q4485_16480 [Granulosicoccaceae sp. 1_MG-2023]|nr:hypothetical protein [Granulosicoccaceae sp. 1_MG-2023]